MPNNARFDSVQVLRALAATLVVFQHALMNWAEKAVAPGPLPSFPHMGDYGVKLFFCISGFIIVHTAASIPQGLQGARTFWRRRLKRIVPLYWIVTGVYIAKLAWSGHPPQFGDVLQSLLFVPYLNAQGLVQPILGQGWSLNYEMLFYLCFGAMLLLPGRGWRVPGIVALMTGLAAARAFGLLGSGDGPAGALYHWADGIVLYFVGGVLACSAAQAWRARDLPALDARWAALASVAIVVGYAGYVLPAQPSAALAWMPLACLVPLMLCITARPRELGPLWQPAIAGGDASYSTYLTHGLLMGPLARLLGVVSLGNLMGYFVFAGICIVACTALGYVVHLLVETPLQRWGSTRGRPALQSAAVPRIG